MAKTKIRLLIFLIVLTALSSAIEWAFAHIPCMCDNPPDQCTCFIQLGDKGLPVERIINVLCKKGYLQKINKKREFTPEVKQAVIQFQVDHDLECTGWMDDETLNALLNDVLPDASEYHSLRDWDEICYVPTDGGQKYHADPTCSGMLNPRIISCVNAKSLGLERCGKESCTHHSALTYSTLGLTPRVLPDEYYIDEDEESFDLSDNDATTRSFSVDEKEGDYIGNKKSRIFHLASCNSVKDMSEKNKIEFLTRNEAIEKGYKPCN